MDEYYKILGVSPDADDSEIENAYQTLKAKYSKERFEDGEVGNNAAKNLTKLNEAYEEIIESRKFVSNSDSSTSNKYGTYEDVQAAIKKGDFNHAQDLLDGMSDRDAEWHYLQSVVFYKKNWINESLKQLEIAMNMDADNKKYSDSYAKLKEKIAFNEKQFNAGNTNANVNEEAPSQMGGSSNECCSTCATWCCMNAVFNLCLNACCHC